MTVNELINRLIALQAKGKGDVHIVAWHEEKNWPVTGSMFLSDKLPWNDAIPTDQPALMILFLAEKPI